MATSAKSLPILSPGRTRAARNIGEALGRQSVLRRVHVEKTLLGETGCRQFTLFNHPHGHAGERRIDLVLPCPQSLLGDAGEVASIDRTERLKSLAAASHGDYGVVGFV